MHVDIQLSHGLEVKGGELQASGRSLKKVSAGLLAGHGPIWPAGQSRECVGVCVTWYISRASRI